MDVQFVDAEQELNCLMVRPVIVIGVVAGMTMVVVGEVEGPSTPGTHAMNVVNLDIMQEIVVVEEEEVVDAAGLLRRIGLVGAPHPTAGQDQGADLVQNQEEPEEVVQDMVTLNLVPGQYQEAGIVLCHEIGNQEIVLFHHAEIVHVLLHLGGIDQDPQLQKTMVAIDQELGQIQDKMNNVHTINYNTGRSKYNMCILIETKSY